MQSDPVQHLNAALSGRYAVERVLGAGGMATVYLASDLRHGRPVAIKVVRPELEQAVTLTPDSTMWLAQLGQAFGLHGRAADARRALARLEEVSACSRRSVPIPGSVPCSGR